MTFTTILKLYQFLIGHWPVLCLAILLTFSWAKEIKRFLYRCWRVVLSTTTAAATAYFAYEVGVFQLLREQLWRVATIKLTPTHSMATIVGASLCLYLP